MITVPEEFRPKIEQLLSFINNADNVELAMQLLEGIGNQVGDIIGYLLETCMGSNFRWMMDDFYGSGNKMIIIFGFRYHISVKLRMITGLENEIERWNPKVHSYLSSSCKYALDTKCYDLQNCGAVILEDCYYIRELVASEALPEYFNTVAEKINKKYYERESRTC